MKRNDITKLHHMPAVELSKKLLEAQKQLVTTRLSRKLGKEKNLHAELLVRKDIARIKTILHEQQLIKNTSIRTDGEKIKMKKEDKGNKSTKKVAKVKTDKVQKKEAKV